MADFKKALEKGLAANAVAEAKRKEIEDVVRALSDELTEATQGVIGIEMVHATRLVSRRTEPATMAERALGWATERSEVRYVALHAFRKRDPKGRSELAEIRVESTGYPVRISGGEISEYAHDRTSFERALSTLLEHPDTGGKIQKLLNVAPTPPTHAGG